MSIKFNKLEPGDQTLTKLLLFSSNFTDEQYLSFLVCGYHHFNVALLLTQPMNDNSCAILSNLIDFGVMG